MATLLVGDVPFRLSGLRLAAVALFALLASGPAATAAGPAVTFTRIAGTGTPLPRLGPAAAIANASLDGADVFAEAWGQDRSQVLGIYRFHRGGVDTVVDLNTPVLPGVLPAEIEGLDSAHGGVVLFRAKTAGSSVVNGLFEWAGGVISPVALAGRQVPGDPAPLVSFTSSSTDGTSLVFTAATALSSGLYLAKAGSTSRLVDSGTPLPDTDGAFGAITQPMVRKGEVLFRGGPGGWIYHWAAGSVTPWVPRPAADSAVRAQLATVSSLAAPAFDGDSAAFFGETADRVDSLYFSLRGGTEAVVNPDSLASRLGFRIPFGPAQDAGNVAFVAHDSYPQSNNYDGVFLYTGGRIAGILSPQGRLDGKQVFYCHVSREALQGDRLVFTVLFEDDTVAVYLAQIPPLPIAAQVSDVPALGAYGLAALTLALAAAGCLAVRRRGWRAAS